MYMTWATFYKDLFSLLCKQLSSSFLVFIHKFHYIENDANRRWRIRRTRRRWSSSSKQLIKVGLKSTWGFLFLLNWVFLPSRRNIIKLASSQQKNKTEKKRKNDAPRRISLKRSVETRNVFKIAPGFTRMRRKTAANCEIYSRKAH